MNFTAIDFETANSRRASICSVGVVVVRDGRMVDSFEQLIRPEPLWFDPFNVSIHGIREADVRRAPRFGDFWPELRRRLTGPIVAHNAAFDVSVLRHTLDEIGVPYPKTDYFCTRVISRLVWPGRPTYALNHVADMLGVAFRHHNAEEDARACARVALEACRCVDAASLYDLERLFGLRVGALFERGYRPCGGPRKAGRRRPADGL